MLFLKDANEFDVAQIIQDDLNGSNPIRQMDKDEAFAFSGQHVHKVLGKALLGECKVVLDEQGFVLCLWGYTPDPYSDDQVIGWLIGTDRGQLRAKEVHRFHRAELREMREKVVAYTIHENLDRWHEALGFVAAEGFVSGAFYITKYVRKPSWAHSH